MLNFRSRLITSAMWLIIPVVSLATTRIDTRNAPCASSAPAGFEYPVGVVSAETLCVGAVRTVDRDAGTYGDEAEDFVAVDRIAAFGQFVVELSDLFVDDECVAAALGRNFFRLCVVFRTRWLLLRPGALPPLRPTDGPEAAP